MNAATQDRHAWATETARRLRAGEPVDAAAIAEEMEELARSDAREFSSRITQILEHLLKLRLVTGPTLEYNRRGWTASILRQRGELATLLEESPSLLNRGATLVADRYHYAAKAVELEYGVETPEQCPFSFQDVLDIDAGF